MSKKVSTETLKYYTKSEYKYGFTGNIDCNKLRMRLFGS